MKKVRWGELAKSFILAMTTLATIVAAYWAADSFKILWAFWLFVPLSLVFAVGVACQPLVKERWSKLKKQLELGADHSRVLLAAGQAQAEVEKLSGELKDAEASSSVHFKQGVLAGRNRVVGEILALESGAILTALAMGVVDGKLRMAARVVPATLMPAVDSYWLLRLRGLESLQALLKVTGQSDDAVELSVEDVYNEDFMSELAKKASRDGEVPGSLEIVCRPFESIEELREEYKK